MPYALVSRWVAKSGMRWRTPASLLGCRSLIHFRRPRTQSRPTSGSGVPLRRTSTDERRDYVCSALPMCLRMIPTGRGTPHSGCTQRSTIQAFIRATAPFSSIGRRSAGSYRRRHQFFASSEAGRRLRKNNLESIFDVRQPCDWVAAGAPQDRVEAQQKDLVERDFESSGKYFCVPQHQAGRGQCRTAQVIAGRGGRYQPHRCALKRRESGFRPIV